MPSTLTLQSVVNLASTHLDLLPLASVGGFSNEPGLSLCNDVLQSILAPPNSPVPNQRALVLDWKWNRAEMNMLVTTAYRQDYLFAGATFFSQSGGAGIDLASNNALTISGTTVTIKTLEPYNGVVGDVGYIRGTGSNYDSTFTQNGATSSFGGCTYVVTAINGLTITATVSGGTPSGTSGAAGITDFGWLAGGTMVDVMNNSPILPTRVLDAVRDIQPYGFASTPLRVAVISDLGTGVLKLRLFPVASNQIWGLNLVYQKKAPLLTALSNTWSPVPDELSFVYRQGFLARGYRYINSPHAEVEEAKFQGALRSALGGDDREESGICLVPEQGLVTYPDRFYF